MAVFAHDVAKERARELVILPKEWRNRLNNLKKEHNLFAECLNTQKVEYSWHVD